MTPEEEFAKEPATFLRRQGYSSIRQLPTGEWAAILPRLFTYAICVGLDAHGFHISFDFETHEDAIISLRDWDGKDKPPGNWVKAKSDTLGEFPNPLRSGVAPKEEPPDPLFALPVAAVAWGLIEKLRAEEGDCVTILCDNPEGPPNNAIECNGWWTGYVDRRFEGETVIECLKAAVAEMEKFDPKNPPKIVTFRAFSTTYHNRGIVTDHVYPPIPPRVFDWCAHFDDDGEEAGKYGWGETEAEAVAALIQNHGERNG